MSYSATETRRIDGVHPCVRESHTAGLGDHSRPDVRQHGKGTVVEAGTIARRDQNHPRPSARMVARVVVRIDSCVVRLFAVRGVHDAGSPRGARPPGPSSVPCPGRVCARPCRDGYRIPLHLAFRSALVEPPARGCVSRSTAGGHKARFAAAPTGPRDDQADSFKRGNPTELRFLKPIVLSRASGEAEGGFRSDVADEVGEVAVAEQLADRLALAKVIPIVVDLPQ